MNARAVLLVVLVLGSAALAFSLLGREGVTPRTGLHEPSEAASSTTLERGDVGAARSELPDLPLAEKLAGEPVRLQVVTALGVPVPGAKVSYWPAGRSDDVIRWDLYREHGESMEAALLAHGEQVTADENGIVAVAADDGSEVCARSGSDYGQLDVSAGTGFEHGPVRVAVSADTTLKVDVVDTDGRPVVGRMVFVDGVFVSRMSGLVHVSEAFGPTDARGKVVVKHLLYRTNVLGEVLDGDVRVYSRRQFDDEEEPKTIASQNVAHTDLRDVVNVRLVEPVGGVVAVRILDADGEPVDERVSLLDEQGKVWMMHAPAADFVSVFAGVPLDRRWRAVAHCAGQDHGVDVVGPRASGQRVAVDVRIPLRQWRITGRALRQDGSVIANQKVRLAPVAPHPFLGWRERSWHAIPADAEGRLAFYQWVPASVQELSGFAVQMEVGFVPSAPIRVSRLLTPSRADVGDLVHDGLGPDRLLAALELRCEGKPVTGVRCGLTQGDRVADGLIRFKARERRRGNILELWGVPPGAGPLTIDCEHLDCLPKKVEVAVGVRVAVDLLRSASLHVQLQCGQLPVDYVHAVLMPLDTEEGGRLQENIDVDQQSLEWGEVPPGRYRLQILVDDVVLHEEAVIELSRGRNEWPMDGSRFALGAGVDGAFLLAGAAKTGVEVDVEGLLVPRSASQLPEDYDVVSSWFLLPEAPADLLVRAWGHVPVRVTSLTGDVILQLQPVTTLQLKQPGQPFDSVRARLLVDPLDPLLRQFDDQCVHDAEFEFEQWNDGILEQEFPPGTKLELIPMRGGVPGASQTVVVGATSPQAVQL